MRINGVTVNRTFTREFLRDPNAVERKAGSVRRDLIRRAAVNHPNPEYRADPGDLENALEHYVSLGYDPQGYPLGWTGPRTVDDTWTPADFWRGQAAGRHGRKEIAPAGNRRRTPTSGRRRGEPPVPKGPVEAAIVEAWLELAVKHGDWVRLARIRPLVTAKLGGEVPKDDMKNVLEDMIKREVLCADGFTNTTVHLAPDSNRKVLTDEDHDAAIRIGTENKHLLAIEPDYFPAHGYRLKRGRWVR